MKSGLKGTQKSILSPLNRKGKKKERVQQT